MKTYRLKIAEKDFEQIRSLVLASLPREAGSFALAGVADYGSGTDVVVRRPLKISKEDFSIQEEFRLGVSARAINGLIALCEKNGLGAVLCHSHPEDIPYSPSDDYGEKRIFEVLYRFIPPKAPTASLLFFPGGVRGRVWLRGRPDPEPISEIVVLGRQVMRIQREAVHRQQAGSFGRVFDRQIRAFGQDGQSMIAQAKVGIVGVGGTGSPTAEQLIRLGVTDLTLIDPKCFDGSNITRMYGTFASVLRRRWWHVGKNARKKVGLVAAHLGKINPKARIKTVASSVVLEDGAKSLLDRDVVFLCTDEHWGRSIVNQIAYQYFIPTINLGMRITAENHAISGASGIVDIIRPDLPCLWCKQFLRADRIAAESMPRSARRALEQEGYVEGIDTPAPSVVSVNTALSGLAVTLFLQLVTDFMGPGGDMARLNYNVMDGTVARGRTAIANECVCKKVRGFGDLKTLPTLRDLSFLEK
jgi:hypothetical protein